ncbi:unnamed protein product, partial [Allacma fusca]
TGITLTYATLRKIVFCGNSSVKCNRI